MRIVEWQLLLKLWAFLLMLTIVLIPAADAQTIHALLVIMDGDASIGPGVAGSRRQIENLLRDIERKDVCRVEKSVLKSTEDEATSDRVKRWIKDVRPDSNKDVVFVYFAGHGGMLNNRTFIALQGGILYRDELVRAMEQAQTCRLKILITDSCSNDVEVRPPSLNPTLESALKNLFVEHKGFLHLAAATEGEYAWVVVPGPDSTSGGGGYFTTSLVQTIYEYPDNNNDDFVSWQEIFNATKKKTMGLFDAAYPGFSDERKADLRQRGITSQTPKYYGELPKRVR